MRGLRVRYRAHDRRGPGTLAVDGIDLVVERGRIVALTGESGSGKSTTLLALAGLLPESAEVEGVVRLDGRSLLDLTEKERARVRGRGMGLVFQIPVVIFVLARIGIVTPAFLLRGWKFAVVASFVISAFITPSPDMVNQTMLAMPMLVLYFLGVAVAFLFGRPRRDALEAGVSVEPRNPD